MSLNMKQGPFEIVDGELIKYHGNEAVVHVPDGVVSIGEGAFTTPHTFLGFSGPPPMCSWDGMETSEVNVGTHEEPVGFDFIREVYLPESVRAIGPFAFQGSANLERVHLPSRLGRIGTKAFARCWRLAQIEVPEDTVVEYEAFFMTRTKVIRV